MQEIPDRWRDLGKFIREQRDLSRLSLRRLSDLAGISNPYLSQIERGLRKPSAEILQQIAKALQLSAETLYERAGLLEVHDGAGDTVAAILRDPLLSDDARHTLIKVYVSLRMEAPVVDAISESIAEISADASAATVAVKPADTSPRSGAPAPSSASAPSDTSAPSGTPAPSSTSAPSGAGLKPPPG